ncbi:MAG: hypothetical protein ACRD3S_08265 [Terracidiphilus sp.]
MFARQSFVALAFALSALLSGRHAIAATNSQPEMSLTLSSSQSVMKAGGPVLLTVTVKNISDHVVGVEENRASMQEINYRVTVLDKSGKEASTTALHRMLRGKPSEGDPVSVFNSSELLIPLDPGKTLTDPIDLSKLYSLSPGTYSVQVERTFDSQQTPVQSNTLTITVNP